MLNKNFSNGNLLEYQLNTTNSWRLNKHMKYLLLAAIISSLQYVNKMIEHAIDTYKQAKRNDDEIDPRLEKLINRLFERNMKRRELRYVIGLALDTRRTDMILAAIKVNCVEIFFCIVLNLLVFL